MSKKIILIILLFSILIVIFIINTELSIYYDDLKFLIYKIFQNYNIKKSLNNFETIVKYKILFLTFDNRNNENFVKIHNENIKSYCDKYNYEYKYYSECNKNIYWCKIYLMLDELKTNKYDYIIWLDSDTIINNFNIDINTIVNMYTDDIFISYQNDFNWYTNKTLNAGIFIIKNSLIGIQFLEDCINTFENKKCLNEDNSLKGIYAAMCYEQGIMNNLIFKKYYNNTAILGNDIFYNGNKCNKKSFILHYCGPENKKNLFKCFQENI